MNLLIQNATVLTQNGTRDILKGVDVLVEDGHIAKVGTRLLLLRGQKKLDVLQQALEGDDELQHPVLAAIRTPGARLRVHWCP